MKKNESESCGDGDCAPHFALITARRQEEEGDHDQDESAHNYRIHVLQDHVPSVQLIKDVECESGFVNESHHGTNAARNEVQTGE